jgi:hypothetical protein
MSYSGYDSALVFHAPCLCDLLIQALIEVTSLDIRLDVCETKHLDSHVIQGTEDEVVRRRKQVKLQDIY